MGETKSILYPANYNQHKEVKPGGEPHCPICESSHLKACRYCGATFTVGLPLDTHEYLCARHGSFTILHTDEVEKRLTEREDNGTRS